MLKTAIFVLVLILCASFMELSYSYESDMHYGLGKWLAVKAGFKLDDAEIIAAGAESSDRSSVLQASVIVPVNICCGKSAEASRHVQQHHFPSDGYVPSPRNLRKVLPGYEYKQNSGNRWVRQEIAVPGISGTDNSYNTNLYRFGQSLHPLNDSWSHQGIPGNIKIRILHQNISLCQENLVWAHSESRGGPYSHDADLTYKYKTDCVEAAKATYYYMTEYLKTNPNYSHSKAISWNSLRDHVKNFAEKKNTREKKEWFDNNDDVPLSSYRTYPCFLGNTSLQGSNKICKERPNQTSGFGMRGKIIEDEVSKYFQEFLTNWIVKGRIDDLILDNANIPEIKATLIDDKIESLKVDDKTWVRTLFAMWLVRDHGLVNFLGHGMPYKKGFHELIDRCYKMAQPFDNLSDAITFPGTSQPYLVMEIPQPNHAVQNFIAFFQFRHASRDMVALIANRESGSWKMTGLSWIIH